jgi:hypothetical protein
MEDEWKISPKVGLGQMKFGMLPQDVDRYSALYGNLESERQLEMPQNVIEETLALFGDSVSDEDKEAFLEGIKKTYTGNLLQVRTSGNSHIVLEFDQSGLIAIQIGQGCEKAILDDLRIFNLPPADLLKSLEQQNGAPGRFRATEAVFDRLAISLQSFSELSSGNRLAILLPADERFMDRTVTLRKQAYAPTGELGEFSSISVVSQQ